MQGSVATTLTFFCVYFRLTWPICFGRGATFRLNLQGRSPVKLLKTIIFEDVCHVIALVDIGISGGRNVDRPTRCLQNLPCAMAFLGWAALLLPVANLNLMIAS